MKKLKFILPALIAVMTLAVFVLLFSSQLTSAEYNDPECGDCPAITDPQCGDASEFVLDLCSFTITQYHTSFNICYSPCTTYKCPSQIRCGDAFGDCDDNDLIINLEGFVEPDKICFNSYGSDSGASEAVRIQGYGCDVVLGNNVYGQRRVCCIISVNQPPVADANGLYEGNEGSLITFDGSDSSDPDGSIVNYDWDLDGDGQYDDAFGVQTQFTWNDDYSGNIGLKVTDSDGLTDTDSTTVTVNNVPPTVEAGPNQEVYAGDAVNFSGSFTDPGWSDTHTILWDFGDGTNASGTLTPSHIYYVNGTYTVTLTVNDDDGGVGQDTLQVVVKPIPATIDCDPDTLNLKSKGDWITCYIELPASYDVKQIDGSVVSLNGIVAYLGKEGWAKPEANESNIMDYDGDGTLERMVKFDRAAVQAILSPGEAVELTITGKVFYNLGLADFEGKDAIRVIK